MANEYTTIGGIVSSIIFRSDESGYAVLKINTDEGELIATGYLPCIACGEKVLFEGGFITHQVYGKQFLVQRYERCLPASVLDIAKYLQTGSVKGIGPKLSMQIAEKFCDKTFDVIENDPELLTQIKGITIKKALEINESFLRQNQVRVIVEFLMKHDLPMALAPKLYSKMAQNAIKLVSSNPYLLCNEYYGVDFLDIDKCVGKFGIDKKDSVRLQAGVIYVLKFNLNNGHTFIPKNKLVGVVSSLLECGQDVIEQSVDALIENGSISNQHICGENAIYLSGLFGAENYLSKMLNGCFSAEHTYDFDIFDFIAELEQDNGIRYSELQKKAIVYACQNSFMVLTGGPGTGKTTTIKGMISAFESLSLNVCLAAPTGRAAKRLSELCGMEAKTVHRLLEAGYVRDQGTLGFQRNAGNPIDTDVIILDEVSMIDILLMQSLIEAINPGTRLILVGDYDQLPPVGPGNLLRDIIMSDRFKVIELNKIFRQSNGSDIVLNAHRINKGQMPETSGKDGDFFIIKRTGAMDIANTVVDLCRDRLPKFYGFDFNQIQVIAPSRKQMAGTKQLNTMLQEALNPQDGNKTEKHFGDINFRVYDKVMQIRNNYDLVWNKENKKENGIGVFNGDIGVILDIDTSGQYLKIKFDDRYCDYPFDMLTDLELAYAITVHKAQGSEFDAVIFVVSDKTAKKLMTRSIMYTAITRAKKLLVMVGSQDAIQTMVDNNTKHKRYSSLRARIVMESKNDDRENNRLPV